MRCTLDTGRRALVQQSVGLVWLRLIGKFEQLRQLPTDLGQLRRWQLTQFSKDERRRSRHQAMQAQGGGNPQAGEAEPGLVFGKGDVCGQQGLSRPACDEGKYDVAMRPDRVREAYRGTHLGC